MTIREKIEDSTVCRSGKKCVNPSPAFRPTKLRGESSMERGYCSYCAAAGVDTNVLARDGTVSQGTSQGTSLTTSPVASGGAPKNLYWQDAAQFSPGDLGLAARQAKTIDSPLSKIGGRLKKMSASPAGPKEAARNPQFSPVAVPAKTSNNPPKEIKKGAGREAASKAAGQGEAAGDDSKDPEGHGQSHVADEPLLVMSHQDLEDLQDLHDCDIDIGEAPEEEAADPVDLDQQARFDPLAPLDPQEPSPADELWQVLPSPGEANQLLPLGVFGQLKGLPVNSDIKSMIWTKHIENVLPEDLFLYGYKVREKVRDFFANPQVSGATKQKLADFLEGVEQPDILQIFIASTVLEGQARVDQLWREGFAHLPDSPAVLLARTASLQCELYFDERYETLTARYLDKNAPEVSPPSSSLYRHDDPKTLTGEAHDGTRGALAVFANPVFVSGLSSESFAAAVAHELYHHRDNHYKTISEMMRRFRALYPSASPREESRARDLADWAIDCIANEAVGIERIELLLLPQDGGYGRRLLTAAAAGGLRLSEEADGRLFSPVQTRQRCQEKFAVTISSKATPEGIFQTLLEADQLRPKIALAKAT